MSKDDKNKPPLGWDDKDYALWQKVASTVKKSTKTKNQKAKAQKGESLKEPASVPITIKTKTNIVQEPKIKKQDKAPEIHSGIDGRMMSRLKKGQILIEATLDLHGLTVEQAQHRCVAFIKEAYKRGYRCVLVITGKGRFSEESGGVLRKNFPEWLHESPLKKIVLTYQQSQPQHGGSGAFYVLLRRIKKEGTAL